MVGRQQVLVEKGNGGGSKWPGSRVAGSRPQQRGSTALRETRTRQRRDEQHGAAQGRQRRGEGGLQPGLSEKGVKVSGRFTRSWDPKCKNHAAVGSTVTQEHKACLGVRKLCQSL